MHTTDNEEKLALRKENLERIKNIIIVMSGKGGVGKSTVSVNTAFALSSMGHAAGLMDIDFHGPSIAKMCGIEGVEMGCSLSGRPAPVMISPTLHVLSLATLLQDRDDAVIWRGPMKTGVIQQFFEDFEWPELDYLIIDCPPGTGDEPLSVIQTIGSAVSGAVIVTTPQDVALLDARKSITFARKLNVPVWGIIENMAGFVCTHCGEATHIFKSGGAEKASKDFGVPVLGSIPLDAGIVESGDAGRPHFDSAKGSIFIDIAQRIQEAANTSMQHNTNNTNKETTMKKIAIPVTEGILSSHFGHAEIFQVYSIENGSIIKTEALTPPPHEPGVIPKWLNETGAACIITGGIGQRAVDLFNEFGIDVISGAPALAPDELIEKHLAGELVSSGAVCAHNH